MALHELLVGGCGSGPVLALECHVRERQLRAEQSARHHRQVALHAIRDGDRGGAAANPDISERDQT